MDGQTNRRFLFERTNNLISAKDLSRETVVRILADAERRFEPYAEGLAEAVRDRKTINRTINCLEGRTVLSMFDESSTRTKLSFHMAVDNLGGRIEEIELKKSSGAKGESIEDTVEVIQGYPSTAAAIIIRHGNDQLVERLVKASRLPIINAGNGSKEHPTQALVDLYLIFKRMGKLDGLNVSIIGDLNYGRTAHSLIYALSLFNNNSVRCIAPSPLQLPPEFAESIRQHTKVEMTENINAAIGSDVIYMTRLQLERLPEPARESMKGMYSNYRMGRQLMDQAERARHGFILMHPLPRIEEIPTELDKLPNSAYFEQAHGGIAVRMSLLNYMIGIEKEK